MREKRTVVKVDFKQPQTGRQVHRNISFVQRGCKHYFNAQHKLLLLARGERAFYDFLCEHMDGSNRITVDSPLRIAFGDFISKVTSSKNDYQPSSASKYVSKLVKAGLLLQTTRNTLYIVNPKYAFNGTESRRQRVLKELIEHRIKLKLPIDAIIDVPVTDFLGESEVQAGK